MKKILLIEDDFGDQFIYAKRLSDYTLLSAVTLVEGQRLFSQHSASIDLIVIDGCINSGNTLNTIPLIKEIRKTFAGPMIAASSSVAYRQAMASAGCSHQSSKEAVPDLVKAMLAD